MVSFPCCPTCRITAITAYSDTRRWRWRYDVADPTAPALVNEFLLSGSYGTARQIGGQVFVMTGERAVRSENVYELLPSCRAGGKMLYPSGGDICRSPPTPPPRISPRYPCYDTSGRARCTDIKTFLGFSSQLYMNAGIAVSARRAL